MFKLIRQESKALRTSRQVCYTFLPQQQLFKECCNFIWYV